MIIHTVTKLINTFNMRYDRSQVVESLGQMKIPPNESFLSFNSHTVFRIETVSIPKVDNGSFYER